MSSSKEQAAEFRRQAAACIELEEDRKRMMEMADHWCELARRAEIETEEPESK